MSTTKADWTKRLEEQRDAEWQVRCRLTELGKEIVDQLTVDALKAPSPELAIKVFDAASKFGRLAITGVEGQTEAAPVNLLEQEARAAIARVRAAMETPRVVDGSPSMASGGER